MTGADYESDDEMRLKKLRKRGGKLTKLNQAAEYGEYGSMDDSEISMRSNQALTGAVKDEAPML